MMILAETQLELILGLVLGIAAGSIIVFIVQRMLAKSRSKALVGELDNRIETAKKQAETIIKEARLDAAGEAMKKREELANEMNARENELRKKRT